MGRETELYFPMTLLLQAVIISHGSTLSLDPHPESDGHDAVDVITLPNGDTLSIDRDGSVFWDSPHLVGLNSINADWKLATHADILRHIREIVAAVIKPPPPDASHEV